MSKKQREKVECEVRYHQSQRKSADQESSPDSSVYEPATPASPDMFNSKCVYTKKSFRYLIKSTWNQIVFTIFLLIWDQTDLRLFPNQSEYGKYNLILSMKSVKKNCKSVKKKQ